MITGTRAERPHPVEDLEPVDPRQHQVEQHEVGRRLAEAVERLDAVARGDHAEALGLEVAGEHLADHRLVVDDQHLRHGGHHAPAVLRNPCAVTAAPLAVASRSRRSGFRNGLRGIYPAMMDQLPPARRPSEATA